MYLIRFIYYLCRRNNQNNRNMKNPKGAGRKVKFKVPSKNYHFRIPNELIEEFRKIYKDKTERFLNK